MEELNEQRSKLIMYGCLALLWCGITIMQFLNNNMRMAILNAICFGCWLLAFCTHAKQYKKSLSEVSEEL